MQQRMSIITITVRDLEVSQKFYSETLGWKKVEPSEEGIAFYQMNGFQFALYSATEMKKEYPNIRTDVGGFTLAYNLNSKDEVDAVFTELKAKNVSIAKEPEEVFWGGYSGYFTGPDGESWEVAYNPYTSVDVHGNFGKAA